jgi:N-hydroxyarylamine O-acetyltransferase
MMDRYLRLLRLDAPPAGFDGLRTLIHRHLAGIPFENVSKLLIYDREGTGAVVSPSEFLDGIEFSDLGGTCYTLNSFFAALLRDLGYDAHLLGADMSAPDVHTSIRVLLGDARYHVDVGFAAPFREPLRLDRLPVRIDEGDNRYLFEPVAGGSGYRMSMVSREKAGPAYVVHDPPRAREFFDPVVLKSFSLRSEFMRRLRISRIFETYSLDLIGRTVYRHEHGQTMATQLRGMEELKTAVHEQFRMPRCPVERAVAIVERITGEPYFEAALSAASRPPSAPPLS